MKEMAGYLPRLIEAGSLAVPIILLTKNQIKAILNRDGRQCLFPDEHVCKGKLTVHHIDSKDDVPENLSTVCRNSNWSFLHNGRPDEEVERWKQLLTEIATEKTQRAVRRGWEFPNN